MSQTPHLPPLPPHDEGTCILNTHFPSPDAPNDEERLSSTPHFPPLSTFLCTAVPMSRPERKYANDFHNHNKTAMVHAFVISKGRYTEVYSPQNAVVVLRSTATSVHACVQWAPLAEMLFQDSGVTAIYVLDFSELMEELPKENASPVMGPILKPLQRCFLKINPHRATLVAASHTCSLAMKLMHNEYVRSMVSRLVLVSPQAPPMKAPALPQAVDVLHTSVEVAEKCAPLFAAAFAEVSHKQIEAAGRDGVMRCIAGLVLPHCPEPEPAEPVPEYMEPEVFAQQKAERDAVRFAELRFNLDCDTKQATQQVVDITDRVAGGY